MTVENPLALRVEKLYENAPLPVKPKTDSDSGFDVCAHNVSRIYANVGNTERLLTEDMLKERFIDTGVFELRSGERCLIGTGLKMTVAEGYEIQLRPRSGNALKRGLTLVNCVGTIDYEYRNEVGAIIINTSNQTQTITLGEKIAQVVPAKVELIEVIEEKLEDNTKRGKDGYGSTNTLVNDKSKFTEGLMRPISVNPIRSNTAFNML